MTITFRPALLPQDLPLLITIFVASVTELGADDYGDEELAAWVSAADDEAAFGERLKPSLTLLAFSDGEPAGFVALKDNAVVDLLYVAPDHAGEGVGTAMLQAIETLALRRGAKTLSADASDLALRLFEKQGFAAQRRNTVHLGGVWLANTTMTKTLAEPPAGRA